MSTKAWLGAGLLAGAVVLALIVWGWRQGGLAVLQLGLGAC
nr:hypothetical protein [Pseudomonas benzenivorans]